MNLLSRKTGILVAGLMIVVSCKGPDQVTFMDPQGVPPMPDPKGYVCYRNSDRIAIDGNLSEASWQEVPWTDYFADIEGSQKPEPRFKTRAKMVWDDSCLYVGAILEEPHLWARLKQRDTIIFYDHDFEVFIDPDGDTHAYYELEVNALGTAWDLLLLKPYRDGGPAVFSWDIQGLQVGVNHEGSLNDTSDTDKGWSVEIKLPFSVLKECAPGAAYPVAGNQWRINFSRVEWRTLVENGSYAKEINPQTGKPWPEDNWVWSPQGRINMHMPEMWGFIQFSGLVAGQGSEEFRPDPDLPVKWALRKVYYYQTAYVEKFQRYARTLGELGLKESDFPKEAGTIQMQAGDRCFEAWAPSRLSQYPLSISADGRLEHRMPVSKR